MRDAPRSHAGLVVSLTYFAVASRLVSRQFVVFGSPYGEQRMTSDSGIDTVSTTSRGDTKTVTASQLVSGDSIALDTGEIVTVAGIALCARDRTMRGRKVRHCRIRVTIRREDGSSGGSVTASQGDQFTKLVGVN